MPLIRDPYLRLRALAAGEDPDAATPEQDVLDTEGIRREQLIAQNQRMSESGRALRQGVQNVKGSAVAARGLVRSLALDDEEGALEDFRESQRIQQEAAEFGPQVQSVEDVDSVGSALEYARNLGLSQLPNIATAAGGGVAGLGARAVAGTVARRAAAGAVSRAAATRGAQAAAGAGGAAAGTLLQSGAAPDIVLDPEGKGTVRERAAKAAVGAVATGSLEALPVVALLRKYGLGDAERALTGGVLSRVSQQAARQGAAEAATEVAQTAGERAAHKWVNENVELIGPEAYAEYVNAAAGGFVGGGIFGAPAGLRGAGRDSEAGKRFQQTMRDWGGRFKRAATPAPKAPRPTPGQPIGATSDTLDMNKVRDDAVRMASVVAGQAKEIGSKVVSKVTELSRQAEQIARDALKDTETENSIFEILDAEPYDTKRAFSGDPGIGPAMDLVRAPRAAQLARQMGVPMRDAIAMSMIDDPVQAATLRKSGAVTEAAKALAGEDPSSLDNDKITAFQDALGPEGDGRRSAFNRVAATAWAVNRDGVQVDLPPKGATRTEPTRNQKAAGVVDEERPLRAAIKRQVLGRPIPRGTPANNLIFTDAEGYRRPLSGQQLGAIIRQARDEDPELRGARDEIVLAEVISDLAQTGQTLEPESVRAMQFGKNWALPAETAAKLRMGLRPVEGRRTTAATNRPILRGDPQELAREPGLQDRRVDTQRNEVDEMLEQGKLGPRAGSPRTLRVAGDLKHAEAALAAEEAALAKFKAEPNDKNRRALDDARRASRRLRVVEGQTIDAPINAKLARGERRRSPIENDDFNDLDRLIERTTGEKVNGDFEARRTLYAQALKKAPKGGRVRAELEDAAARYGEAQYARALKKYQKNKNKKTYAELVKARAAAERGGVLARRAQDERNVPKKVGRSDVRTKKFERSAELPSAPEVRSAELTREIAKREATPTVEAEDVVTYSLNGKTYKLGDYDTSSVEYERFGEDFTDYVRSAPTLREMLRRLDTLHDAPGEFFESGTVTALENIEALEKLAAADVRAAFPAMTREDAATVAEAPNSHEASALIREQLSNARARNERMDDMFGGREAEGSIDFNASRTPEGLRAAIRAPTRSKASLIALKTVIANSTHSETVKSKLMAEANEAIAAINEETMRVARAAFSRAENQRRNKTAQHYNDVRKQLQGVSTVADALARVRELATPAQRRIIDALRSSNAVQGVPLKIVEETKVAAGVASGVFSYGQKDQLNGSVTLTFDPRPATETSQDIVALLLHESVHAATMFAEVNDADTRAAVEQVLEHARTYARGLGVDPDMFYGLSNTQEFLAEAFTNAELQDLLRQIPARNTKRFANLWEEFKDIVARLLGFTSENASALDEIFALGLDLARTTGNMRNAQLEAIFNDTTSEHSIDSAAANGAGPRSYIHALNPDSRRYLEALFRRGDVYRQIKAAVPAHRQDELASADRGPALLIDTGLALAMTGQLQTKGNAVQQLWDAISKVVQIPTKAAYGRALLADLRKQPALTKWNLRETDARELVLSKPVQGVTRFVNARVRPVVKAFSQDMNARMRATGVPALTQLATLISQRTGEFRADGSQSLTARQLAARNKYMNEYFALVKGWTDEKKLAVLTALQSDAEGGFIDEKGALENLAPDVKRVRDFFVTMRDYLAKSGVAMGDIKNYFPVSIDRDAVIKNKAAFIELLSAPNMVEAMRARDIELIKDSRLSKEAKLRRIEAVQNMEATKLAERWYHFASSRQRMTAVGEITFADGEHDPSFRPKNRRLMDFIYKVGTPEQKAQFAKFQDKNMDRVVVQYVGRATRRAEWTAMGMADQIKRLMKTAKKQGATPDQLQLARNYIDQTMGSYGGDWHPWIKKITDVLGVNPPAFEDFQRFQQGILTYQNLRLLPLALMSSFIDPLGVSVRSGGEVRQSFAAYRDALRAMRDKDGSDALRAMAEDMGLIERHAVAEALVYLYGASPDVTGLSQRINATLFKYNGLEYVTKFSRLAALSAGQRFLLRHKTNPNKQSKRYLRELGLKPADIQIDETTGLLKRSPEVEEALARFVDEAVVRPTPQQRPGWHNDPHFALAAQYKGYLYSFFNTISRRGMLELQEGNPAVLVPLLMYLPVTAMGEMIRDMAQGDDEEREALDYARLSVERSGLLGPHVGLVQNARQDLNYRSSVLNSVAGPTGQQLAQAYDTANGERNASRTAVEALPASALFEDWFQ